MVANKFLTETSQATMSGFSAEYVNRGSEQECRALCAGGNLCLTGLMHNCVCK